MSSESIDAGDDPVDEISVFADANTKFQSTVRGLDDESPGYAVDMMTAINDFLETIAAVDPSEMVREQTVAIVAEHTDLTKKSARRELRNHLKKRERQTRDRPEITAIVREDVDRVEALASTETDGDIRYRFVFRTGGTVVLKDDALWSATGVRRACAKEYGRVPVFDPVDGCQWEDVVDEIFETKLEWKADAVGPRQTVIERVRELVEKHAAYTEIAVAYSTSGVYIEDPESDVVYVESSRIDERAKEKDETLEGIRWEMDDKGLRVGPSKRMRVGDGKHKNFWPLDRQHFEPKRIETGESDGGDDE